MKILVTGITGMLGNRILKELMQKPDMEIIGISKSAHRQDFNCKLHQFDLVEDIHKVKTMMAAINPQVVIHCAANTSIEYCEKHKAETEFLHITATGELAKSCKNAKFIYISTDSVFDGKSGNFSENDLPCPINFYAQTKLKGENAALSANNHTMVVRTNMYGFSNPMKNSLLEWAIKNFEKGAAISGFNDVFFNPLYTGQLAKMLVPLMDSNYTGIIHLAAKEYISKLSFLKMLAAQFGFGHAMIENKSMDDFPQLASRPKNTTLNATLCKQLFFGPLSIKEGIQLCHQDFLETHHHKA